MRDFWKKRDKKKVSDKEININVNMDNDEGKNEEPSREPKGSNDSTSADAEIAKLAGDLEDLRQTLLRRQADFENYRKRIDKERGEDWKRATARVVEGLIPVIDGFEHALAAHRESEYENYRKGFELIYKQLLDNVTKLGVERIDPTGRQFDPHLHQAMERTETTDEPDGTILQVFQPGYLFHGRVLRAAMVRVAVHPQTASKNFAN